MNSEKLDEFNNILDSLDAINESSATDFYVPSLKKKVKFSPITITHQRMFGEAEDELWSTGADQLNYIYFCKTYDKILKETCLGDIDVDTFLSIDRIAIALQHRIQINKEVDISTRESEDHMTIDLSEAAAAIKKIPPNKLSKTLKYKSIQVTVGFPTLSHDREINKNIEKILNLENESATSSDDVEAIIEDNFADLLIALLAKHILEINVDGKIVSLDSGSSVDMFISAIQRLPLSLLKKINDSYESYKNIEGDLLTISYVEDEESTDILLDITTGLFTGI